MQIKSRQNLGDCDKKTHLRISEFIIQELSGATWSLVKTIINIYRIIQSPPM